MAKKKQIKNVIDNKIADIKTKLDDIIKTDFVADIIKDNKIEFIYNNIKYRVSKPTFKQKQEVYQKQIEKYIQLLQDRDDNGNFKYYPEEDLKKIYKERQIDIDAMRKKMASLESEINKYQLKLGELLSKKVPETELKIYRDKIQDLSDEQMTLSLKINKLLEYSLENQVLIYAYSYLTYLITEKLIDDKWVKAWDNYDDFINSDESLVNTISYYAMLVSQNEIETISL